MIFVPTNKRIIRPSDKPSFEHTQRYGLIKGHWANVGRIGLWVVNEGSGKQIYDLSRSKNTGAYTGVPDWSAGFYGPQVRCDDDQYITFDHKATDYFTDKFTVVWVGTPVQLTANRRYFFVGQYQATGVDYDWGLYISGDPYTVSLFVKNTDTDVISSQSTSNFVVGEKVCVVGRYDGVNVSLWWNGVKEDEDAQNGNVQGSYNFRVGGIWIDDNYADVKTDYLNIYNRALTASEIAKLCWNPFTGIQKEAAPVYFFVPVAAPEIKDIIGGYNLTASGTTVAAHPRIIAPTWTQSIIVAGETHEIECTADGQATAEAATKIARKVAGTADATSIAAASVKVLRKVSGGADGQSTASCTITTSVYIAGIADAQSTAAATVTVRVFIVGTADAQSTAEAAIKVLVKIACTADAQSTAEMNVIRFIFIIGTASGLSTAAIKVIVTYAEIPPAMHADLIGPYGNMGAWLWLAEIVVPTQTTQRIARNTAAVVYGVTSFTAGNFDVGRIPLVGDGSIPHIQLRVAQNGTHTLEDIVNTTKGGENGTIKLIRTCEKYFGSPVKALERTYDILTAGSDPMWVTFMLGIPNQLTQRIPLWSYSSKVCPLATPSLFKGPKCQYAGGDTVCTGLFEDCYTKGNAIHWGAEIGLDPSAVRV